MKLPIKITRGHAWSINGYERVWNWGRVTSKRGTGEAINTYWLDCSEVKAQLWVADWLYRAPSIPETIWRRILCRLWLDRLSYQYECGYAAGLKEGLDNYAVYATLTQAERDAITSTPPDQQGI